MDFKTSRDIAKAAESSPFVWATSYVRLPNGRPWDFVDRKWQLQIFDDPAKSIVVMKPTQVGMTTIAIVQMLHFLRYHHARGMYTFPRWSDVKDFVTTRFEPMVRASPYLVKLMKGVDNIRNKQIGRGFIHFNEASVEPRMLDIDFLINDEVDLSDPEMLAQYPSRLDASKWGIHYMFSTPSVPGLGIDALFSKTDRKEWMVKCPGCNHWQILEWDKSLQVDEETDRAWYACVSCGRILAPWDIDAGNWVPQNTGYKGFESGYHVSQMMMPRMHPPTKLWRIYKETPIKVFYNLRLGKPFRPAGGSLTREVVLDGAFRGSEFGLEHGPKKGCVYYGSFDQGNDLYALIGRMDGDVMRVVWAEVFPFSERGGWRKMAELFKRYNCRLVIGDGLPNRHPARDLQDKFPSGRVMLAIYSEIDANWTINKKGWMVNINRSEMLDMARNVVVAGGVALPGRKAPLLPITDRVISHLTNMERDEIIRRTPTGQKVIAVYRPTGPDHFAHCLVHLLIAHEVKPVGKLRFHVVGAASRELKMEEPEKKREPLA